jgi:hypothetical protein
MSLGRLDCDDREIYQLVSRAERGDEHAAHILGVLAKARR